MATYLASVSGKNCLFI